MTTVTATTARGGWQRLPPRGLRPRLGEVDLPSVRLGEGICRHHAQECWINRCCAQEGRIHYRWAQECWIHRLQDQEVGGDGG
uniref:Uncharacterized protein n=1 Tax=Oryza sativa subsp. japonica TaxID=39947 RepID=Q69PR9_ORYSJ|nr:hypothetical protein [Oryza sativa Japonica Group]BAD33521.1 hypothetical protein [Oryza sativa Japonica Group]